MRITWAASILLLVGLAAVPGAAQDSGPAGELRVEIVGLELDEGAVGIALYDSRETYSKMSDPYTAGYAGIRDRQCVWVVPHLPLGEYAVTAYHDTNGNLKLDTNLFGIPREPYGFSNNPKVRFGPPKYDKVRFVFDADTKTIEIRVK